MPAVASTDSANPAVTASRGSTSSRTSTATPSAARARGAVRCAHPDQRRPRPSRPRAATLGSARASSTKPTIPSTPDDVQPAARGRRPTARAPAGTRPPASGWCRYTASRWVSPVVRKSSASVGSSPRVVAVHQRRHQRTLRRRRARRPQSRTDRRTPAAASHHTSGPATTCGSPSGGPARRRRRHRGRAARSSPTACRAAPRPVGVADHHARARRSVHALPRPSGGSPRPGPPAGRRTAPPPRARPRQLQLDLHDSALLGQRGEGRGRERGRAAGRRRLRPPRGRRAGRAIRGTPPPHHPGPDDGHHQRDRGEGRPPRRDEHQERTHPGAHAQGDRAQVGHGRLRA